jgi:ABC-type branched-subunit amino acid transport system ATPase component
MPTNGERYALSGGEQQMLAVAPLSRDVKLFLPVPPEALCP